MVVTSVVPRTARQGKRRAPNTSQWKKDELWWAKFIGNSDLGETARQQSTGRSDADVWRRRTNPDGSVDVTLAMEHKMTHSVPQWFDKALRQDKDNMERHPGAPHFIGITYHSPSRKVYRILARVVYEGDEWDEQFLELPEEE